ncbi:MAG: FISUMP domain-containing protein [Flavobacteriales bacterium]
MTTTGIIGGAGFIGSHATKKFLAEGHRVRVGTTDLASPECYAHLKALLALPFFFLFFCLPHLAVAQSISVTFEGLLNGTSVALDSVVVKNLTSGGDTTVYDTEATFTLGSVGVHEAAADPDLMQCMPNPFTGSAEIVVRSSGGEMLVTVHDATGRELAAQRVQTMAGQHRFRFTSGGTGIHFVSVQQNGTRRTLSTVAFDGAEGGKSLLTYLGGFPAGAKPKSNRSLFSWQPGDALQYTAYITDAGNVLYRMANDAIAQGAIVFIFGPGTQCAGTSSVTDIDGNHYPVVQIGDQCWMGANLKTSRYRDGTAIGTTSNGDVNGWHGYPSVQKEAVYGRWYTWYAVNNAHGVCPTGWHVPSDAEWMELRDHLGGEAVAGGALKSTASIPGLGGGLGLWQANPNGGATNSTGFTALAAGGYEGGGHALAGQAAWFWTSTPIDATRSWLYGLSYAGPSLSRQGNSGTQNVTSGYSVRCVMD